MVKSFDNFNDYGIEPEEINIKKCIKYVSKAWNNVTSTTIFNCWKKANILPEYGDDDETDIDDFDNHDIELELARLRETEEVQVLIDKLDFDDALTADEFIEYDESEPTNEIISDEDIIKAVLPEEEKEKDAEEEEIPVQKISHQEALMAYDTIITYLEQGETNFDMKNEELKFVKKLKKEALKQQFISTRQTNLDGFVNVVE